ncbi:MAG: hypothetical protein QOF25_5701 [Mycobacterium sp.]|nr:hypothetical protein [Mycobacterium sp.]
MNESHSAAATSASGSSSRNLLLGTIGWIWVGVPFCYGLLQLVVKIPAVFTG